MNIIFHIDVNNAFLSWSAVYLLQNGYKEDIRLIPSVIAGDPEKRHGIILAKSNIAKQYGIKTADTLYLAKKKCPNIQIFPPIFSFYKEISNKLYEYFLTFTPDVERYSIDECFLDLTGTSYLYDDILKLAYQIKEEIKAKFGFTVNIGIGNNKLCAKMAGDFSKPDKVHTLFKEEIEKKMWILPIEDLLYIGKTSSNILRKIGINTIGDLAKADSKLLQKYFKNKVTYMQEYANGIDDSKVISKNGKNKCISFSETLEYDTDDKEYLKRKLLQMCEKIGFKLRENNLYATTIAITLKNNFFKSYSHQKQIKNQTNNTMELYENVLDIFEETIGNNLVRNIGVRVSDLVTYKNAQLSLFTNNDSYDNSDNDIWKIIDNINNKYDNMKIMPAIFYKKDK